MAFQVYNLKTQSPILPVWESLRDAKCQATQLGKGYTTVVSFLEPTYPHTCVQCGSHNDSGNTLFGCWYCDTCIEINDQMLDVQMRDWHREMEEAKYIRNEHEYIPASEY